MGDQQATQHIEMHRMLHPRRQTIHMSDLLPTVAEIESVFKTHSKNGLRRDEARRRVRNGLQHIASLPPDSSLTLSETIKGAVASCPSQDKRTLAIVLVRLVGVSELLSERDIQQCRKEIVNVIEDVCPDLTKDLFDHNHMNHEKIVEIGGIHRSACGSLEPLGQPFASLRDLAERRQDIMRSINRRKYQGYLGTFGYKIVLPLVRSLLGQVDLVVNAQGHELQTTIQQLLEDIPIQMENCEKVGTFVTTDFAMPFLQRLYASALAVKDRMAADFACEIRVPEAEYEGEKGYPLHRVGAEIEVSVPLVNSGPGVAQNVTSYCVADNCKVQNAETRLGNVEPGSFVLPLVIELTEPTSKLMPMAEVKWSMVGDPDQHSATFTTLIRDNGRTSNGKGWPRNTRTALKSPTMTTSMVDAM